MKLFKKSTMSLALAAAMTGGALMGISAPASAVNIAHDGLGQALVFPYYTTRNGWETFFNLTNTSDKTVLAKVRWREGRNSRDVRDFNIILSPYDVWTAATVDGVDGAGMITTDNSCTFPRLPAAGEGLTGISFTDLAYVFDAQSNRDNRDFGPIGLDRTREGYFEVIEMATISQGAVGNAGILERHAEHEAIGNNAAFPFGNANSTSSSPDGCETVRQMLRSPAVATTVTQLENPLNVLKGRAVLINSAKGIAAGYDPLTLANFAAAPLYFPPDDTQPNLSNAVPATAVSVNDNTGLPSTTLHTPFTAEAVNQLISRTAVINDYNIGGDSETDWVLTFPTKNFSVDQAFHLSSDFAAIPFSNPSIAPLPPFDGPVNGERFSGSVNGQSCFDVNINIWDREEYQTPPDLVDDGFSPKQLIDPGQNKLCYEANIFSFGDSNVFSSVLRASVPTSVLPAANGWAEMTFGPRTNPGAALPVIGMRMEVRNRGNSSVNFGFANDHAYKAQ